MCSYPSPTLLFPLFSVCVQLEDAKQHLKDIRRAISQIKSKKSKASSSKDTGKGKSYNDVKKVLFLSLHFILSGVRCLPFLLLPSCCGYRECSAARLVCSGVTLCFCCGGCFSTRRDFPVSFGVVCVHFRTHTAHTHTYTLSLAPTHPPTHTLSSHTHTCILSPHTCTLAYTQTDRLPHSLTRSRVCLCWRMFPPSL